MNSFGAARTATANSAHRRVGQPEKIPSGPAEKYDASRDLLSWLIENFKKYGDIYKAYIYGCDVYVVSDPQYADHVLRENWRNYKKGQAIERIALLLGNGLMVSEGELWKTQRRMMQPAFHQEAVGALMDTVLKANTELLLSWERAAKENASVDVTQDVSTVILEVILTAIFGEDYERLAPHFRILTTEPARDMQFAQAFSALGKLVARLLEERLRQGRVCTDLLGMLMAAHDRDSGQAMPNRLLVSEILTLIVAGHETTASTLTWTWCLLSQYPDVEKKLSDELHGFVQRLSNLCDLAKFTYTGQVLEEVMRLYPPGWLMTRKALEPDRLGDYFVPAGTEVYISPYLIQRHPAFWDSPDDFIPERFSPDRAQNRHPMAMLPFSAGPRKCIGELLARMEMQVHLITIARQLRLRSVRPPSMEFEAGVNLRGKEHLIMVPEINKFSSGLAS